MSDQSRRIAGIIRSARDAGQVEDSPATVTAVTPGAAADGNALVTIRYDGVDLNVPYMEHYTPSVGQKVSLTRKYGRLVIDGALIGFPPDYIPDTEV